LQIYTLPLIPPRRDFFNFFSIVFLVFCSLILTHDNFIFNSILFPAASLILKAQKVEELLIGDIHLQFLTFVITLLILHSLKMSVFT